MKDPAFKIAAARLRLMQRRNAGLLAEIGYSLEHVSDDSIDTLDTDGKQCLYNPAFFSSLDDTTAETALAHEYAHVALMHPVRHRKEYEHTRENIAMDHAVNLMLKDAGFSIPPDWYADAAYTGMSWEYIYTAITSQPKQQPQPKPASVQGDVRPYPGKDGQPATEHELSEATAELSDRIMRIAQAQEMAGNGSEQSRRLIARMTTPRDPDLYEALAALLERSAEEHTWRRVNRRLLHAGIYPGLDGEQCPPLIVVVDTSGSITDNLLAAFNAKVRRAVSDFRPRTVTVIYCDSRINGEPQTYTPDDMPDMTPHGGGGTDFRPPFAWVSEQIEQPARGVGHHRRRQDGELAHDLGRDRQNGTHARRIGLLQRPWCGGREVAVGLGNHRPDGAERLMDLLRFHRQAALRQQPVGGGQQRPVFDR